MASPIRRASPQSWARSSRESCTCEEANACPRWATRPTGRDADSGQGRPGDVRRVWWSSWAPTERCRPQALAGFRREMQPANPCEDSGEKEDVVTAQTPSLKPGASVELSFRRPPGCFTPDCHFWIVVDSDGQVDESDESNNTAEGRCPGWGCSSSPSRLKRKRRKRPGQPMLP
jgi:hypothetical protein